MILKGSQRGGARQLAAHLLNTIDNDHVTVLDLRGFVADDLYGAMAETQAIAKGTRCQQCVFSLSLNPPQNLEASIDDLTRAADRAGQVLGLADQPRAMVIHEKGGRRHAHVVFSRIDAETMTAINLPFYKERLKSLSKELYLEHGWELPDGYRTNGWKNPLNFTLAEWQQAKRLDLDPRELKTLFQSAWQHSDNAASFHHALEEHGYYLAKGDRRGFVALDVQGNVFSLSRWLGVNNKTLGERLGTPDALPSVDDRRETLRTRMNQKLRGFIREDRQTKTEALKPLTDDLAAMVAAHRAERIKLQRGQDARWKQESKTRSERINTGLRGFLDIVTGRRAAVSRINEREAYQGMMRDRDQREALFMAQSKESKPLHQRIDALKTQHRQERMVLARQIAQTLKHQAEHSEREPDRMQRRIQQLDLER